MTRRGVRGPRTFPKKSTSKPAIESLLATAPRKLIGGSEHVQVPCAGCGGLIWTVPARVRLGEHVCTDCGYDPPKEGGRGIRKARRHRTGPPSSDFRYHGGKEQ